MLSPEQRHKSQPWNFRIQGSVPQSKCLPRTQGVNQKIQSSQVYTRDAQGTAGTRLKATSQQCSKRHFELTTLGRYSGSDIIRRAQTPQQITKGLIQLRRRKADHSFWQGTDKAPGIQISVLTTCIRRQGSYQFILNTKKDQNSELFKSQSIKTYYLGGS